MHYSDSNGNTLKFKKNTFCQNIIHVGSDIYQSVDQTISTWRLVMEKGELPNSNKAPRYERQSIPENHFWNYIVVLIYSFVLLGTLWKLHRDFFLGHPLFDTITFSWITVKKKWKQLLGIHRPTQGPNKGSCVTGTLYF